MISAAVDTDRESIHDWLRLTLAKGIGGETARKLLRAFGLPTAIFDAAPDALRPLLSSRQLDALFAPPDPKHLEATLAWLEQPGNTLITLADAGYPRTSS